MPVIPPFLTEAGLKKRRRSGRFGDGITRPGDAAASETPMPVSDIADLLGPGLLTRVTDKAGVADDGGVTVGAARPVVDDRPAHIAQLADAIHVTRRNRALAEDIRDTLVRRATGTGEAPEPGALTDAASPLFVAEATRDVARLESAALADRPAGLSDAARLAMERHAAAMRASAIEQAKAVHERAVMGRAMDELDASADSMALAASAGDDLAILFEELADLAERFGRGLDDEVVTSFVDNTRRELIEANVLGLTRRGAIEAAQAALAQHRDHLPDGQAAFLERGIERGKKALADAAAREHGERMALLRVRANRGDDVLFEAEQLAEDGLISLAERRRIERLTKEAAAREARENALKDRARDAVQGGAPLDPANRDDALARELWWRDEAGALFADMPADRRAVSVAVAVARLGAVPQPLRRDLILGLRNEAQALEAAQQIMALDGEARDATARAFTANEIAHAGTVTDLANAGDTDPVATAQTIEPLGAIDPDAITGRPEAVPTGMAAGDDEPFVPSLSIAGLGPEEMAALSRAVDEAEARAEQDRRIVEAYQAPTLLRETFDKLRDIHGGEGVWVVGGDRRVHLTDSETGEPITGADGQPISVGEAQILLVASAIARDRAGAPGLTLEGIDVAMSDRDGVMQIDLHAFDDPVFLGELGGIRPRRDGHGASRLDAFAPAMLGIGLGVLLGIEDFAIVESDDADTPDGGEGDGPDDDETEEEGEGKKDLPIPVDDAADPDEGGAVAAQGQPGAPQPVEPPPGGSEVTEEDRARAQRIADGTADFIDEVTSTKLPTARDLAIEALRVDGIKSPDETQIQNEIKTFDLPPLRFGEDGETPLGGHSTEHTGGTPEQRYEDTRVLAKTLFPWLDGLREAGFFNQTGRVALTQIPAQTENVRENILRGLAAIDALLSHPGPGIDTEISNVMFRADLADVMVPIGGEDVPASTSIDFLWGSQFAGPDDHRKPRGIVHLIAEHGIEEIVHMVNTIANGEIQPLNLAAGSEGSVNLEIKHEGRSVFLSLLSTTHGESKTWVVTAYKSGSDPDNQPVFNIAEIDRSTLLFRQEKESF